MDECSTGLNNHLSPTDRFRSYIIEFIRSNDLDDTHQTNSSARVKSVKSSKHNGVLVTRPVKDRTQILKKCKMNWWAGVEGCLVPLNRKAAVAGKKEEKGNGRRVQFVFAARGKKKIECGCGKSLSSSRSRRQEFKSMYKSNWYIMLSWHHSAFGSLELVVLVKYGFFLNFGQHQRTQKYDNL